ncbi:DNA-binding protein rhl1 [Phtheirospermum japonicum]|uniref:DNA-binding protein rhl1 n=1 Tax=Phtheirospermum japonicum TaxID=374723 RepID=A0A830C2L3_9LAMI|nr:DNA-binding protein rhl1 [Phtheirospermum japonicum]
MARGVKKEGGAAAVDPEAEERLRLKKIAFSRNILSQSPAKVGAALGPSKTVIKHHGNDILRKSQRKNRYLFSFPGLLGPISGGKIGDLKDLGTKNPILYLDFPQGQMKLFGTIVYPKNRYLTLQFPRGGKNVTCDDYFDNMIVFSDAWWIGTKEENPEELQLQFPKDLNMDKCAENDFKGGVGAPCDAKQGSGKPSVKCLGQDSPEVNLEDDLSDSPSDYTEMAVVTPARQSARTAGKTFNFAEVSSGDDLIGNGDETPEEEDEKVDTVSGKRHAQKERSSPVVFEIDNEDSARQNPDSEQCKETEKAKDLSGNDQKCLVQTTLSSMFKRVGEKKTQKDVIVKTNTSEASKLTKGRKKAEEREPGTVAKEQKKQQKKIDIVTVNQKKSKAKASGASSSKRRRADVVSTSQSSDPNDSTQAEDDDIEEFSSTSQDMSASDEDWTA